MADSRYLFEINLANANSKYTNDQGKIVVTFIDKGSAEIFAIFISKCYQVETLSHGCTVTLPQNLDKILESDHGKCWTKIQSLNPQSTQPAIAVQQPSQNQVHVLPPITTFINKTLPKVKSSDHGKLGVILVRANGDSVKINQKNLQTPWGIRLPRQYDNNSDPQYKNYYQPKWDGCDLHADDDIAAKQILGYECGAGYSKLDDREKLNKLLQLKEIVSEMRKKFDLNDVTGKEEQVNKLKYLLNDYTKSYPDVKPTTSGLYAFEDKEIYRARRYAYFKKMHDRNYKVLLIQEISGQDFDDYKKIDLEEAKRFGFTITEDTHDTAIFVNDNIEITNTANRQAVEAILDPIAQVLRHKLVETKNEIYISFHAGKSLRHNVLVSKLIDLKNSKNIDKPIIIGGDLNRVKEIVTEINNMLISSEIDFLDRKTRGISNEFETRDVMGIVVPVGCNVMNKPKSFEKVHPPGLKKHIAGKKEPTLHQIQLASLGLWGPAKSLFFDCRNVQLYGVINEQHLFHDLQEEGYRFRDTNNNVIVGLLKDGKQIRIAQPDNSKNLMKKEENKEYQSSFEECLTSACQKVAAVYVDKFFFTNEVKVQFGKVEVSGSFLKMGLLIEFQIGLMGCSNEDEVKIYRKQFLDKNIPNSNQKYDDILSSRQGLLTYFSSSEEPSSAKIAIDTLITNYIKETLYASKRLI